MAAMISIVFKVNCEEAELYISKLNIECIEEMTIFGNIAVKTIVISNAMPMDENTNDGLYFFFCI